MSAFVPLLVIEAEKYLPGAEKISLRFQAVATAEAILGPRQGWPDQLRTLFTLLEATDLPAAITWGKPGTLYYNAPLTPYLVLVGGVRPHGEMAIAMQSLLERASTTHTSTQTDIVVARAGGFPREKARLHATPLFAPTHGEMVGSWIVVTILEPSVPGASTTPSHDRNSARPRAFSSSNQARSGSSLRSNQVPEFFAPLQRVFPMVSLESLLADVLARAAEVSGCEQGSIHLFESSSDTPSLVIHVGRETAFVDTLAGTLCPLGVIARKENRRLMIDDLDRDPEFAGTAACSLYRQHGISALQAIPLLAHNHHPLGVLINYFPCPHESPAHEQRLLDLLARTAVGVIEQAHSAVALKRNEEKLRGALEIETVGIIFFNTTGMITGANDAFLRMSGYDRDDLEHGRVRWDDMTPPEWMPRTLRAIGELAALGRTLPYEKQYIQKDGTRWWGLLAATRLSEDEGVEFIIDISERIVADTELRRHRDNLEMRVQERTTELDSVNGALRDEIVERQHAEKSRQELLRQLASAQEEERRRLSRELHDEIGQHITTLMLGLKSLETSEASPATVNALRSLQTITETVGKEIHQLAVKLRPTALDDLGLLRTLANYIEQWSAQSKIEVDFHHSGWGGARVSSNIETTAYRIIQEALNNVLKHAKASRVSVILERGAEQVKIIIEDDGNGFDLEAIPRGAHGNNRLGLLGMAERAALMNGEVKVESSPGKGTTVFVRIPLHTAGRHPPS